MSKYTQLSGFNMSKKEATEALSGIRKEIKQKSKDIKSDEKRIREIEKSKPGDFNYMYRNRIPSLKDNINSAKNIIASLGFTIAELNLTIESEKKRAAISSREGFKKYPPYISKKKNSRKNSSIPRRSAMNRLRNFGRSARSTISSKFRSLTRKKKYDVDPEEQHEQEEPRQEQEAPQSREAWSSPTPSRNLPPPPLPEPSESIREPEPEPLESIREQEKPRKRRQLPKTPQRRSKNGSKKNTPSFNPFSSEYNELYNKSGTKKL